MKKLLMILVVLGMSVSLVGCSSSENPSIDGETRVVTDARGEVEIPVNPERIADLSGSSDVLSILDYKVAGTTNSDAYDFTKFPTYLEDILEGATILGYSMQDTMDIEAVIAIEPDLIIISTVQEKMYEQLQEIAPTIMLEKQDLGWKEDILDLAQLMERETEAKDWISDYETQAEEVGTTIRETYGEDTSYLAFLASGGQFFVFSGAGFGDVLYNDLGLNKPDGMPDQDNISLPVVTYEGLAAIDADYIFVLATDEDLAELQASSVWNGLAAVQANQVAILPSSPYFNQGYSPIGRQKLLTEIPQMLNEINK